MQKMSKEDLEFHRLNENIISAETENDKSLAWIEFIKFRKNHEDLVDDILKKMSKEEKEYHDLVIKCVLSKTDGERELAEANFTKFEKEYPVLADEIQSRRWID